MIDRIAARAALARLLLGVVAMLLAAGLAELAARALHQPPWWNRLLSEQRRAERHEYRRNRHHLRDRDYDTPKTPDTRRVLFVGDSFTFGLGVRDDAKIFPEILERRLNETRPLPGVERIEVLNAAVSGSYAWDWIHVWRKVSREFDPDVLVIVFFLRDGTHKQFARDFFARVRREIAAPGAASRLYRHSALWRLLRDEIDRRKVARQYARMLDHDYFADGIGSSSWRKAQQELGRLADAAARQSVSAGFVVFPALVELNEDYPFRKICETVGAFARSLGMPLHDLLQDFLGEDAPSLWVSPFNQHPNERAHEIVARALLPFVSELLRAHEAGRATVMEPPRRAPAESPAVADREPTSGSP
jgi:lysophospholipase L1-like esterase